MSTLNEDIIIATSLDRTADLQQQGFITHALCLAGSCTFRLGAREHRVAAGDCLIIPQQSLLLHDYAPSADFRIEVIYVSAPFTEVATPQSNYGMRGHLALFEDPVMHLTVQQQKVCALNFDYIRRRLALPQHNFHRDAMLNAVQCMIIDFFDFHVELFGERHVTNQQTLLMQHFMSLLDCGEFVQHRDVAWYADALCVTPKGERPVGDVLDHALHGPRHQPHPAQPRPHPGRNIGLLRLLHDKLFRPLRAEKPRRLAKRPEGVTNGPKLRKETKTRIEQFFGGYIK